VQTERGLPESGAGVREQFEDDRCLLVARDGRVRQGDEGGNRRTRSGRSPLSDCQKMRVAYRKSGRKEIRSIRWIKVWRLRNNVIGRGNALRATRVRRVGGGSCS